jgi:hypothetical protein
VNKSSSFLSLLVVALASTGAPDAHADLPNASTIANEPAAVPHAQLRAAVAPSAVKLKAALKADPRVAPLTAALVAAATIKDKAARKVALDKLGPQILAVRADAVKKAGIDPAAVEASVRSLATLPTLRPMVPPPGTVLATSTISSFPKTWSVKRDCGDADDRIDFDGPTVKLRAVSTPLDADCWVIRGGRTGSVTVPKGASRMLVQIRGKVDLDVTGIHFGTFAEVWGSFGIRIASPTGVALSTAQVAGRSVNLPAVVHPIRSVHTRSIGLSPIPVSSDGFEDNLQEGDQFSTALFDLPENVDVGTLDVTLYTGAEVDADLSGVAIASNDVVPQSLKVTFYK